MNKYARLAKHHWETTDPARYRRIEEPQTFFTRLGEQAETQMQELAQRLAGPDRPGEYLRKVRFACSPAARSASTPPTRS